MLGSATRVQASCTSVDKE